MTSNREDDAPPQSENGEAKGGAGRRSCGKDGGKGPPDRPHGQGQGQVTAAFGLLLRAVGRGFRVGVVQFGKGAWETGEREAVKAFGDRVVWHTLGEGFTWETQDRARDVAAAERAWSKAIELMEDGSIQLLILDELNISLRYDHLDLGAVLEKFRARRPTCTSSSRGGTRNRNCWTPRIW